MVSGGAPKVATLGDFYSIAQFTIIVAIAINYRTCLVSKSLLGPRMDN
jgi:hypothetical protein